MRISAYGLQLLKKFEGCRLTAYWDVDGYSIGYGHHEAKIYRDMKITQTEADRYLRLDLEKFEKAVESYGYNLNQNQFDALVDFSYNCGIGNLKALTNAGRRSLEEIANKLPLYNKAGGVVLKALTNRRLAEQKLFNTPIEITEAVTSMMASVTYYPKYEGNSRSLINALKEVGVEDTSIESRTIIAEHNNILSYTGTVSENTGLLNLLKNGKLRR